MPRFDQLDRSVYAWDGEDYWKRWGQVLVTDSGVAARLSMGDGGALLLCEPGRRGKLQQGVRTCQAHVGPMREARLPERWGATHPPESVHVSLWTGLNAWRRGVSGQGESDRSQCVEEARLWRWGDARESSPGTRGVVLALALALARPDDSDGGEPKWSVGSRVPVRRARAVVYRARASVWRWVRAGRATGCGLGQRLTGG
jgi:hypothetical protein